MSRQKAHVTPLRGSTSKPQPYASTTGLACAPELPPRNPPRNIRNERATTARTVCGLVSRAVAEGLTHTKRNSREKTWSGTKEARNLSTTSSVYNQTLRQNDSALKLVSASDSELLATGKPMLLKEFSKGKSLRDLPCLVKVVGGHRSLCGPYSFGREQMFVILEKKSMRVATCKDHKGGSSYAVPLNTTAFHLVPFCTDDEGIHPQSFGKITANELLQSKALPPVIAVSEEFEVNEDHSKKTVPVGTLLFPKEIKQSKDQRQFVLHTKSESGEMIHITPDCIGCFSILAYDVRLSLRQALNHFKPPFTMQTISDCDDLYIYANVVTVERVHIEDVLIGMMKATEGTSIDDASTFSRMAEVPVSVNLTVVTMVPRQRETLNQIYDFVLAEYHGIAMNRPAMPLSNPADTVIMATDPVSSVKLATPFTPSARVPPGTPLQLSVAPPNDIEEHIYDVTDDLEAMPTNASQQKASPDSEAVVTTFQNDTPPSDAAAIDFYDVMPTAATIFDVGTFKCDQPPSKGNVPTFLNRDDSMHRMHKEQEVFIEMEKATEGTPLEDVSTFSHMAAVPVSLNFSVVTMEPKQRETLDHIYDSAHSDYDRVLWRPVKSSSKLADTVLMAPNPAYIDTSITTDLMKAESSADPASVVKSAPSTPLATTRPSTPLQLSVAAPNDKDEHIYDVVDNYMVIATAANLQMASLNSEAAGTLPRTDEPQSDLVAVDYYEELPAPANQQRLYPDSMPAGTPFKSDSPPYDVVAVDYYEELPTTANQQRLCPDSMAGTPCISEQYLLEKNVPTCMKQDNFAEDTDANIAYLKKMQSGDILQLLDAMNLSVYKEAFEQEQIDGDTMACLTVDMLSELGVSKPQHRLRLMKIVSGQTSVSSFII